VIIGVGETLMNVRGWCSVYENVVGCLEVEGFLDFGVRRDEEVNEWDGDEKTS
jgi:hypothetical protein